MKTRAVLLIAVCFLALPGFAHADLQQFMTDINTGYSADVVGFQVDLASRFPATDVTRQMVILSVDSPADAVVSLWLHEQYEVPISKVLQFYQQHEQRDWVSIATRLGLAEDSTALETLQRGEIDWFPQFAGLN